MRSYPALLATTLLLTACRAATPPWPPALQQVSTGSPVLSAEEALQTFFLPPGYRVEIVASEPLMHDPVAIDFDADGRMYVVEMRGYMPDLGGEGETAPIGRVVVLEDGDGDGRMDRSTVFLDSLVLPRAVKVLERGVLVAAPPFLWLVRDADGDLRADSREVVRDDYGNPEANPEHNANGLLWGIDNWIHSADHPGQLRLRNGGFEQRPTARLGQWGVSTDDFGRLYRNSNESPLHVDLVSAHYFARNPHLTRTRGVYLALADKWSVWPVRPTPGVNRGYREQTLREDGTLAHFTSAGSPIAYRGDRLPRELRNNVFVTEPAGNLVRRYVVADADGQEPRAENAYEEAEFLASTDERFRPVNLYSAPDGTLYVVDMYRGVIEHAQYMTGYLEQQIRLRGLDRPVGLGRIYRVVHRSTRRDDPPRLSAIPAAGLVEYLSHPNGWWRDAAQQLIVQRGDRSAVPALRRLALDARDERVRLHALWTLDGLGVAEPAVLTRAMADRSAHVRAAAIRIAEPWLRASAEPLRSAIPGLLADSTPVVRRQLAASLGELPPGERESLLTQVIDRHGADPIVVDLVVSALPGRELPFLESLLEGTDPTPSARREAVRVLAATAIRAGGAETRRLFTLAADEERPRWQRLAILEGIGDRLPGPQGNGGRVPVVELSFVPTGLLELAADPDPLIRDRAAALLRGLAWPGRTAEPEREPTRPRSVEEERRFAAGEGIYAARCAGCHQSDGEGREGLAPSLVGSARVLGGPGALVRILLHGKEGEMLMPPMGAALSDEELAEVLTYVRRAWSNAADPIDAFAVREVRGQTMGRDRPWTEEELARVSD